MSFVVSNSTILKTTNDAFRDERTYGAGKDVDRLVTIRPDRLDDSAMLDLERAAKEDGDTRSARAAAAIVKARNGETNIAVPNFKAFYSILSSYLEANAKNGWIFITGADGNAYPELVTNILITLPSRTEEEKVVIRSVYYGHSYNGDKICYSKNSHTFQPASLRGRRVADILSDYGIQVATDELIAAHEASIARYQKLVAGHFAEQYRFTGTVLATENRWDTQISAKGRRVIHDLSTSDYAPYSRLEDSSILIEDEGIVPEHPVVRVFDLGTHDFYWVHESYLTPYVYDHSIREKLILPRTHHDLLEILTEDLDAFIDDIVEGKATGNVVLCKGQPGVGKTTTAEAYSEIMEKPLYRIHAGSLGTTAETISKNIKVILDRALRWNCVLLLDEADVFIKKRGDNLEQNAVVAEFLRALEYINAASLIFLTTNRPDDIDDAIISRCAAIIEYLAPTPADMRRIWEVYNVHFKAGMDDALMDQLIEMFPGIVARDANRLLRLVLRTAKKRDTPINADLFRRCAMFRAIKMADHS